MDIEIYSADGTEYLSMEDCSELCTNDLKCGAFEWRYEYCSWWKTNKCQDESESTINNAWFYTCRKPGT